MSLLLAAALLFAGQLVDGHVHKPPHGGVIAHAGPYHVETVVSQGFVDVWLLDKALKVVPPAGHSLAATVRPGEDAPQRLTFAPHDDHFRAAVDLSAVPAMAVEVRVDAGRRAAARASFRWTALDARQRLDDSLDL
jgi:hypothetical protein